MLSRVIGGVFRCSSCCLVFKSQVTAEKDRAFTKAVFNFIGRFRKAPTNLRINRRLLSSTLLILRTRTERSRIEERFLNHLVFFEMRHSDADQTHTHPRLPYLRNHAPDFRHEHMFVIVLSAKLRLAAFRCAVGKTKLKSKRRPLETIFTKPTCNFGREHIRRVFYRVESNEVLRKRHLVRNGLHGFILLHGSCINTQASHAHHFAILAVY